MQKEGTAYIVHFAVTATNQDIHQHHLYTSAAGYAITVANDANALGTLAKVKERIILSGGVIASMAMSRRTFNQFLTFQGPETRIFTANESLISSTDVVMHAIFCYGWWDNPTNLEDGWWLCKNRCAGCGLSARLDRCT
jgi:hypothetical protein